MFTPKDDWKELAGLQKTKTNLIFSDADHSYEGIVFEYDHFYKENIADEFIIYFDDINSKTFPGLYKVTELMNENRKNKINCYTFLINGWMGKNRNQHRNAILTNVDIEKFLKSKLTKLKDFKRSIHHSILRSLSRKCRLYPKNPEIILIYKMI